MAPPEENEAPAQASECALINPNLRQPPKLNLITGNKAENYKTWKSQIEIYLIASDSTIYTRKFRRQLLSIVEVRDFLKLYFECMENEDKKAWICV